MHEKKIKETYSFFCGALKTLKPELANLLAYGADDEEALSSAFGENFERTTQLLCSIHLKKNAENRLVQMGITRKIKEEIFADIFGRQVGDVYERGRSDAESQESFSKQMEVVKGKWSKCNADGLEFFQWFVKKKKRKW